MIDPAIHSLLVALAIGIIVLGIALTLVNLFAPWYLRVATTESLSESDLDEIAVRKIWRAVGIGLVILGGGFLIWNGVSGEANRQIEMSSERRAESLRNHAEPYLIEPLSDAQIDRLLTRELSDPLGSTAVPLVLPDGSTENASIHAVKTLFGKWFILASAPVGDYLDEGEELKATADEQRGWQFQGAARDSLEERYSLPLTDEQFAELLLPTALPERLTRYGTIPLTVATDAGYLNINATLIWDGDFKLVGIPGGGEELQELPSNAGESLEVSR